jgi:hypothetical protein
MYDGANWSNGRGGWYICDGQNGTPDLRDKFIKCKGSAPSEGGSNALTADKLPKHTHDLSGKNTSGMSANSSGNIYKVDDPSEQIACGVQFTGKITPADGCISVPKSKQVLGYTRGGGPLYAAELHIDVSHTHSFPAGTNTGNNSGVDGIDTNYNNMPKYYSVIYIKKMQGNNV